ncbi:MAG: NAD-dependent epimerase/dehydratase family protein [Rhodothermales bacterium]
MTFFLTGATGFLGSQIAHILLDAGHEVRAIRRSSSKMDLIGAAADRIDWIEGDVLDPDSLESGMKDAEGVIHAAAFLGFEGKKSEEQLMSVNVDGTANVVDAAIRAGIKRMVHVSSIAALSRSEVDAGCRDESAEWEDSSMNTGYAISKHRAEMEVHRGIAMGLDAVIVNPSLIMGVGRPSENTMQIADRLVKGGIPFVPKGGTNVVDVRDVAAGCLRAFENGRTSERYILAGHNLMWEEILATMGSDLDVTPPTRTLPTRLMMGSAALFELGAVIVRRRSVITRETIRLSMSISCYDNTRSIKVLGCTYRPFSETSKWIAEGYRALEG